MSVNMMRTGGVMRSSYLRMTRAQTVTVKRWRNQSSHDLKKQFEKFQHQRVTESPQCQDILARTRQGLASGEETECKIRLEPLGFPPICLCKGTDLNDIV